MCTARPGWQSISLQKITYKDRMYNIKIDMPDILKIDEENRFVSVEPMVTIGVLNDFLIGHGWTLPVVPELDDLTIGGLVMGGGIESTSHKYGLFQYICRRFEMVLGDGRKVVYSFFLAKFLNLGPFWHTAAEVPASKASWKLLQSCMQYRNVDLV